MDNLTKKLNKLDISKPELFELLPKASTDHSYFNENTKPIDGIIFNKTMRSEMLMLQNNLPPGIYVKFFEDRLDLCTAMIEGPAGTPYAGCLFIFDVKIKTNYPASPPSVKFLSFCATSLNPNLYTNGLVCLSLLGTWSGSAVESWSATKSSLLQVFVSLQGLVLVVEPFYNEPCYHGSKGTKTYDNDSKSYNFKVLKSVLETMLKQIKQPPSCFQKHVIDHYRVKGLEIHRQIEDYLISPNIAPFPLSTGYKDEHLSLLKQLKDAIIQLEATK